MLAIVVTGCDSEATTTASTGIEAAITAAEGRSDAAPADLAPGVPDSMTAGGSADPVADPDSARSAGVADLNGALAGTGDVPVPVGEGDSGDNVVALQERLADLGFAPGEPDGAYGQQTIEAVEAFQTLAGLGTTGTADVATMAALEEYRYDGPVLHAGDDGSDVVELQERLASGPFDPGTLDGNYGTTTIEAVWALEKLAGVPVDGDWGPFDEQAWQMLIDGEIGESETSHDQRWVEVDLSDQLMKVYDPGQSAPVLVSHISSGNGTAWSNGSHSGNSVTPLGEFEISRRIAGWRQSSLGIGSLYNPLYFNGGIALHGARSVPLYPASHGCIRVPMHVADYLPAELPDSTPVHILA